MKIRSIDKVFAIDGLGKTVKLYLKSKNINNSGHVPVTTVVKACHKKQKEAGIITLFEMCATQFHRSTDEKRLKQYAEVAFRSYKILKKRVVEESASIETKEAFESIHDKTELIRTRAQKYEKLWAKVFDIEERHNHSIVEIPEADVWLQSQKFTLSHIVELAENTKELEALNAKIQKHSAAYEKANRLTTLDGTLIHAKKTLHGNPYDQNRLGKLGPGSYVSGFERFYIAGSAVKMPYRCYDVMQAPLIKSEKKVDTIKDFWDTVVVMRKSPIIITTHDPKEKRVVERAEYWTQDRFKAPMELRGGWQLSRIGEDELLAQSKHSEEIKLVKRQFVAKNPNTAEEHLVTQFHYQGWPDFHGAPDHELLDITHQALEREFQERNLAHDVPVTVHCAAGMGRSPLFAASNHIKRELMTRLENGEKIDEIELQIPKTIYHFKKQRPAILTGDEQLQSLFLSVRRAILQLKGIPNEEIRPLELLLEAKILKKELPFPHLG